jgi:hypothetical protein
LSLLTGAHCGEPERNAQKDGIQVDWIQKIRSSGPRELGAKHGKQRKHAYRLIWGELLESSDDAVGSPGEMGHW